MFGRQPPPRANAGAAQQVSRRYADNPTASQRSNPSSRSLHLRPVKLPDNNLIYRNLAAVSASDIPSTSDRSFIYLLVNEQFVFSAVSSSVVEPGTIGLFDDQRTWANIAMTDQVSVRQYQPDGGGSFLAAMDVEVGFRSRRSTDKQFDPDELAESMRRIFHDQILAPGQRFIMDVGGIPLSIQITTVSLGDFSMEKGGGASVSDPSARAILTRNTDITFFKQQGSPINLRASMKKPAANAIIRPDFKFEEMGIGGLDEEFTKIFRRAFASRLVPLGLAQKMQLQHVKGILLYGPPGTGKTLIARKIGQALNAKEPKVINGPEVLNKYVGQSEENIRKLFIDAEQDEKALGDESPLHVIIFDELDAVCKQRGSGAGGGTGVGDSVVNQLLSKLDGVHQLNNILLIGMTNRKDMIDDALLRPGRLELHVEISLPDEDGRVQILGIHTANLRSNNLLGPDVDLRELASRTKNFSGAEISGLVRAAQSFAFMRHTEGGNMARLSDNIEKLQITRQDFLSALEEVHSAFGISEESLTRCIEDGILNFSPTIDSVLGQAQTFIKTLRDKPRGLSTVLFHGPNGSGKTALAAFTALKSDFPMVRLISAYDTAGMSELGKVQYLMKAFEDAYKSPLSLLIIDGIERLIDWNPIGPRFSNTVLGQLETGLRHLPPSGHKLLVFGTTSRYTVLQQLNVSDAFEWHVAVPNVATVQELGKVLELSDTPLAGTDVLRHVEARIGSRVGVGIKGVLAAIRVGEESPEEFVDRLEQVIHQTSLQ